MTEEPPPGSDRATSWIVGAALALATMSAMAHAVGPRCDWLVVALIRALFMLLSSAALVRASGSTLVLWRPRTLWVRSLAGSCSLVCNFYAITQLPSIADAVTLMNVHPLWIVLATAVVLRRRPSTGEVLGVACGLLGVILIERPHFSGSRLPAIAALLSSLSTAVAMLGLHRLRRVDPRAIVAHFAGVATLVSAWLVLRGGAASPGLLEAPTLALLLGIGVSGTLGQILLTKAYAAGAPARVAVVGLVQVVFAMGFDVLFWQRPASPINLVGIALVLAPTTWLNLRSRRPEEPEADPNPTQS